MRQEEEINMPKFEVLTVVVLRETKGPAIVGASIGGRKSEQKPTPPVTEGGPPEFPHLNSLVPDDLGSGKPNLVATFTPVNGPQPSDDSILPGTEIRFDHVPFGGNDFSIRNRIRTNEFLTPIAEELKANQRLAVTIQILTNLTEDQLGDNLKTVHPEITGNQLMWNRGLAIQKALLDMGVDSRQVVFMYRPSVPEGGGEIKLVFRRK
ncbi:MAG: hypothetical protein RIB71_22830 [Imperialibacter sp.]|uniref:hypothetical protein n=1 Tax=Imperialibacter sp. TaxID=2038411 RepID=UPI0032EAA58F